MAEEKKGGFFSRLREGMQKTRDRIADALTQVASGGAIDDDFYDDLEGALIAADVGVRTSGDVVEALRAQVREKKLRTAVDVRTCLKALLAERMGGAPFSVKSACVLLIVGVNGVGKTTSIGKLAHHYAGEGKKVLIAAADTFRAAAAEQLSVWAERAGVPLVRHTEGSDPAAVVFDAIASGKARGCDMIIVDTAGRLHNKAHLMEELKKIRRVIDREYPDAQIKCLLVLDATTGQNGLNQAEVFTGADGLDGIILTKLDGTAKGGIAIAVRETLGLPVAFVGVGEGIEDMKPFVAEDYIEALL
jgi:fused signal recognition particle receptor